MTDREALAAMLRGIEVYMRRMGAFEQADLARQYADWNETLVHAPPLIGLNVHVLPGAGWTS